MQVIRCILSIALISCVPSALRAQRAAEVVRILESEPPRAAAETEREARVPRRPASQPLFYLRDRSKIAGMPKLEALSVRTRYGVLSVPRDELVRVRLVRRIDPDLARRITTVIAGLGDDDFDVRENAMEALRGIGLPALPLLRKATESDNEEVKNRAEILVDEFEERQAEEADVEKDAIPRLEGTDDEIMTTRMTIRGMVELEKIAIASRYGDLLVNVADIQAISFQRTGPSVIKLDVQPKYQPPGNWLETKLSLEKGQKYRIEASGNISVSNYGVTSGPAGTRQWSGNSFNNFPMLALIAKIGKKGKPFLVGTDNRGKATKEGKLYLAIVAFSYNPTGAVGKYEVKIRTVGEP